MELAVAPRKIPEQHFRTRSNVPLPPQSKHDEGDDGYHIFMLRSVGSKTYALKGHLQAYGGKQKGVQESIKKHEKASKEADMENAKKDLVNELDEAVQVLQQLQDVMVVVLADLAGRPRPSSPAQASEAKAEEGKEKKKNYYYRQMSPDEQEISYELKSKYMENVNNQNNRLRTEIMVQGRMGDLLLLNARNRHLQEECQLSRTNAFKLVKMFERKAKRADAKLEQLEQELHRAQELARKYQNLYELERQARGSKKQEAATAEGEQGQRQTPPPQRLHRSNSSSNSLLGRSTSVADVIRRNEHLVGENDTLHREVQRLKRDNADLLKKAKDAMQERDRTLHQLGASERSRQGLQKCYQKEKAQHQLLSRSLTRQASDWIESKRQQQQMEEEIRLTTLGPVSPHDAERRTYAHPVTANVYQPRKMYPVENYAQANKTAA